MIATSYDILILPKKFGFVLLYSPVVKWNSRAAYVYVCSSMLVEKLVNDIFEMQKFLLGFKKVSNLWPTHGETVELA